jgi:hypothetical protein
MRQPRHRAPSNLRYDERCPLHHRVLAIRDELCALLSGNSKPPQRSVRADAIRGVLAERVTPRKDHRLGAEHQQVPSGSNDPFCFVGAYWLSTSGWYCSAGFLAPSAGLFPRLSSTDRQCLGKVVCSRQLTPATRVLTSWQRVRICSSISASPVGSVISSRVPGGHVRQV